MSTAPTRRFPEKPRVELGKLFDKLPPHALEAEVADGFGGGGALGVEDGWFRQDGDMDFHGVEIFGSESFGRGEIFTRLERMREMTATRADRARHEIEKISPWRE